MRLRRPAGPQDERRKNRYVGEQYDYFNSAFRNRFA